MKTPPTVLQQELIGLHAKIVENSAPNNVGIEGKVLDETCNTITILHKNKNKIIIKSTSVFNFTTPDGTIIEINGQAIIGRPKARIKKRVRRLW